MSPEIPALAGRRAGSMQNPGEETGWARCGAGPRAPRPPQTPAPTRTPQHPGVHLPARGCCRTAALRAHPTRYVPATRSRGHRRCCPHRRSLGRAGVSRPATHPVPIHWPGWCQGTGTPTCGSGGCPTPASCGQEAFPSLPPCSSHPVSLGVPSVAPGTCVRCPGCVEPLPAPTPMSPGGHSQPWGPGSGDSHSVLLAGVGEDTVLPGAEGPWECGSVTLRGSDRGASRLGGGQRLL